jgi:hypothetical protein
MDEFKDAAPNVLFRSIGLTFSGLPIFLENVVRLDPTLLWERDGNVTGRATVRSVRLRRRAPRRNIKSWYTP